MTTTSNEFFLRQGETNTLGDIRFRYCEPTLSSAPQGEWFTHITPGSGVNQETFCKRGSFGWLVTFNDDRLNQVSSQRLKMSSTPNKMFKVRHWRHENMQTAIRAVRHKAWYELNVFKRFFRVPIFGSSASGVLVF